MKVQILGHYGSIEIDSSEADLDLETGILSNFNFDNESEKIDNYYEDMDEDESEYVAEMDDFNIEEDSYYISLIKRETTNISYKLDIKDIDKINGYPSSLSLSAIPLEVFRISDKYSIKLMDAELKFRQKKELISEKINQLIIYLEHYEYNHLTYGSISDFFYKDYDYDCDYRLLYANWFKHTQFLDKDKISEQILNKERDFKIDFTGYIPSFEIDNSSMNNTEEYNYDIDYPSVMLTNNIKKIIEKSIKKINKKLNIELNIRENIDVDFRDKLRLKGSFTFKHELIKSIKKKRTRTQSI